MDPEMNDGSHDVLWELNNFEEAGESDDETTDSISSSGVVERFGRYDYEYVAQEKRYLRAVLEKELLIDRPRESLELDEYVLSDILQNHPDILRKWLRGTRSKSIVLCTGYSVYSLKSIAMLGEVFSGLEDLNELILKGSFLGINALAFVVRRTRQIRLLTIEAWGGWGADGPLFARALAHHPFLENIKLDSFPPEEISSVFHTLPRLRSVEIERDRGLGFPAKVLHPEVLSDIMQAPSLYHVSLSRFLVSEMCIRAISEGLCRDQCRLTQLVFSTCEIAVDKDGLLPIALERNTSLKRLRFSYCKLDPAFIASFRRCLTFKRTLRCLDIATTFFNLRLGNGVRQNIPETALLEVLEGVRYNGTLQALTLPTSSWTSDGCDLLRETLKTNVGLERLSIQATGWTDDDWRRIIPFLDVNTTLESLTVEGSLLTKAIIPDTVDALERNSNLLSLTLLSRSFSAADHIEFVGSLNTNSTLKELRFGNEAYYLTMYDDEAATAAVAAVQKNYGLVKWNGRIDHMDQRRLVDCTLLLNKAGRHYLVNDPASRAKGVRVLSQVSENLDCLFLHLQENPLLCACGERPVPSRKRKADECF